MEIQHVVDFILFSNFDVAPIGMIYLPLVFMNGRFLRMDQCMLNGSQIQPVGKKKKRGLDAAT